MTVYEQHGLLRYTCNGCRCTICRKAMSLYVKIRRIERQKGVIPDKFHGTTSGYCNWYCRCDTCVLAWRKRQTVVQKAYRSRLTSEQTAKNREAARVRYHRKREQKRLEAATL